MTNAHATSRPILFW